MSKISRVKRHTEPQILPKGPATRSQEIIDDHTISGHLLHVSLQNLLIPITSLCKQSLSMHVTRQEASELNQGKNNNR